MGYLPGQQRIVEESLEAFALAHTYYVSLLAQNRFNMFQYVRREIEGRADQLLIERLLSIAAKARFLDDQAGLIKKHDRASPTLGKLMEGGVRSKTLNIRIALNKVIHHKTIGVRTEDRGATVISLPTTRATKDLKIPSGSYKESVVIVAVAGELKGQEWTFELNLFGLLNELLRVFYLNESN